MTLKELVDLALTKNDLEFNEKYTYWVVKRRKVPDLHWLMPMLERVLGKSFVKKAAKEEINGKEVNTSGI